MKSSPKLQARSLFGKFQTIGVSLLGASFVLCGLLLAPSSSLAFDDFTSDPYEGEHKIWAIDTEHFTIEFSPLIYNLTDSDGDGISDRVEDIAEYAEYSWEAEVEDLGMPTPLDDQDTVYLILDDRSMYLTPGSLGVTSILPSGDIYFAVDPTLSLDLLEVTVAHEFMHVIQFGYEGYFVGYDQDINFAESMAVWTEDYVYDDVNDYYGYLDYYFDEPDYSVFTGVIPDGSLFEYSLVIWPRFITEYFDDDTLVKDITNAYFSSDPDVWDHYDAYYEVMDDMGEDLREVYQQFALWNHVWTFYEEGISYPWVAQHAYHYSDEYPLVNESVPSYDWPALFGANYLQFELDSDMAGDDFQVTLTKSSDIDLGVIVLPESEEYYLVDDSVQTIFDAGTEEGIVTVPIEDDYVLMTLIVTPLSEDPRAIEDDDEAFEVSYQYLYSVEVGDFGGEESIESSEESDTETDSDEGKEGDDAGENITGEVGDAQELDELTVSELTLTSSTSDSVTLTWTRASGDDVQGYVVYYGTESEDYYYYEEVEGAHVTHATIDGLWADTFYFAVTAYDSDYNESETLSNEVTVTLEMLEFTDVYQSHDNYDAIRFLTYLGVIEGYSDETFRPNNEINRAELMKVMVYGWLGYTPDEDDYGYCFPDVSDEWFAPYVCYAYEEGWVQGYNDGNFYPANTVSKVEALKMILNSYGATIPDTASIADLPYDDVYGSAWYAPYLVTGYELGILEEGDGSFDPNEGRTRAEVCEEIFRLVVIDTMAADVYDEALHGEFMDYWGDYFL